MKLKEHNECFVVNCEDVRAVAAIAHAYRRSMENNQHDKLMVDYENKIQVRLKKIYPNTHIHLSYVCSFNKICGWMYRINLNFIFSDIEDIRRFNLTEYQLRDELRIWKTKNLEVK